MALLPSFPTGIYCLSCLLHVQGLKGYTGCSYQQNYGPECKKSILPFYQFYCKHLLYSNMIAPLSSVIPLQFQYLMVLPHNG